MFFKKIDNGKYRYYEKFYDESEGKWKQASVTLTSKTRQAQGKAKKQLEEKIEKKSLEYDEQYKLKQVFQKMTVREVYDEYKIFRKQELKDSTFAIQNVMLSNILKDILDDLIVNVTSFSIQKYFMISPNSFKYKKTQKSLINLFFKYSLKLGYIEQNPIEKVEIPKQRKDIEDIQKKRTKFLSIEEMKVLKQSFGNSPQEIRMNYLIEFMYLTGLRIGEALALMWENINLENKIINVKYTLDTNSASIKEFKLNSPKTIDSYRLVSISVRCIEILLNMKKLNVKSKKANKSFIFLSETDSLINPNSLNIYLKKIARKACFENKKPEIFSSHMLRHSHVSLLTELGVPIKVIMERVGHRDEKTTLQIYTHVTKKMENDVVEKLNLLDL
ncbi:tyrosine-type recombinase/integrase [Lactococcus carnosus]|uniref:tyrosine-type recombinase/integrase n=2 Tax=Pseudolactococcus carnosus TaxID=2749961 RepID=UPI0008121976|nr:site-specific integrase [Lactococcus carnosus]SCA92693.1 putative Integrase protein [Lactococcus piscium]MCJ1969663.1 site-specific integrase [Lactococcus carnosus]MCJ1973303.1 site-specific integrase [Lactococcus carnosus]MCJ1975268.1 site-specific integrase [Lactococcus carnosus]MCJ1978941.1 site-specific integrase [Lactococcus carnosus]